MNVSALSYMSGRSTQLGANDFLESITSSIEYAFQPIVNIHTGAVYGFEALLRGHERMGLPSIQSFFDHAWQLGILHQADLLLRHKALRAFSNISAARDRKLFFNLDGRCFESPDYSPEQTKFMMKELSFPASTLCLELSEKYDNSAALHVGDILARCRSQSFHIAIDDYGDGFSQLKMLYDHQPDYLKIDRFFIDGIATDNKKKLMVRTAAQMAHTLGITVIAEGMESEEDLLACLNAGCDMAQGYLIQRPQTDLSQLLGYYEIVTRVNRGNRRKKKKGDRALIGDQMDTLPSVMETDDIRKVLDIFQGNDGLIFLPVVELTGRPRGLVRESSLRALLYNPFGHALLTNKGLDNPLEKLIVRCPVADIDSSVEDILTIYAHSQNPDGILIVEKDRYVGFLSAQSLLHLLHEKRLEQACDQNPLSKLPGNHSIMEHVAECLELYSDKQPCLVYFDFNDFKPFNDQYGFRQGDRAILLFTEIMKRQIYGRGVFLGHIGGDDFFAGFRGIELATVRKEIETALSLFARDIESFYDPVDRKRGYIECQDRNGDMRRFPLLTCSAAIIVLEPTSSPHNQDALLKEISRLKKQAKKSPDYIAIESFS